MLSALALVLLPASAQAEPLALDDTVAVLKGKEITYAQVTSVKPPVVKYTGVKSTGGREMSLKYAGRRLSGLVMENLLDGFAVDNRLEPTDKDIEAFVTGSLRVTERLRKEDEQRIAKLRAKLADPLATKRQKKKDRKLLSVLDSSMEAMDRTVEGVSREEHRRIGARIAGHIVKQWKINQALYEKYGGRVIFQQAGPEPLDAYLRFLREHEKKGSFVIVSEELKEGFWEYYVNDKMHTFYSGEEGGKFMKTPWWLMQ